MDFPARSMASTHESDAGATGDRAMVASYLIVMFVAGPTLGLIGLALPHAPDANDAALIALSCGGYAIGGALALFRRRLPMAAFELAAGTGSVLISAAVYFSGANVTTSAFYYLWVILGAAYFFTRAHVVAQVGVVAVGYAVALILKEPHPPGTIQAWIVAVGTLTIAATLMVLTREHINRLVARLAEAADTDPLTELLNRRGFNRQLELELERAQRSGTEVSLITGDLDHFKQVNDSFGHQTGDEVLVQIGDVLRGHARRIDSVARIGGEEFALLLPTADSRGAYVSAERLRHRVREAVSARHPGLTISFGVASYPSDGDTAERLLRCADESLYAAKTLGRDRTVIYSREVVGALAASPGDETGEGAANLTTLLILAEALDLRDERTIRHSQTVGRYAAAMARELGFEPDRVERVRLAGVLHDIGNIGVADSILYESGPLTDEEWAEIRTHPETGARLLSSPGFGDLRAWVLAHHERMDGTGYPLGLVGEAIPIEARIIAVADAFEGMLGDRPHRPGRGPDEALAVLRRYGGTQFDPDVVAALAASLEKAKDGAPAPAPS